MPSEFSLPSFAKINWFLRILGKRPDGYHELSTLFQSISLPDTLHFAESDVLELTCDDPSVPTDDRNLIVKAVNALHGVVGKRHGARIHLEKRVPSPGGLWGLVERGGCVDRPGKALGHRRVIAGIGADRIRPWLGCSFLLLRGTAIGRAAAKSLSLFTISPRALCWWSLPM